MTLERGVLFLEDGTEVSNVSLEMIERAPYLVQSLTKLLDWAREHTSPIQENSPHEILVEAHNLLAEINGEPKQAAEKQPVRVDPDDLYHGDEVHELLDLIQNDWAIHDLDRYDEEAMQSTFGTVLCGLMKRYEAILAALEAAEGIVEWSIHNSQNPVGPKAVHEMILKAISKAKGEPSE